MDSGILVIAVVLGDVPVSVGIGGRGGVVISGRVVISGGGVISGGDGSYLLPLPTIAEAIAALPPGCLQIRLFPGLFAETVNYGGLELDIRSLEGPEVTTIDPPAGGSVITIASGEGPGALLAGVSLRGGTGTPGYGGLDPAVGLHQPDLLRLRGTGTELRRGR